MFLNQAPACGRGAWFLKINSVRIVGMHACVCMLCMCVSECVCV